MFSAIRKHLNPATLVAVSALVFAMTGGAFAVTGHGSGGGSGAKATAAATPPAAAAKAKPKGKAGPRGPAGPKGATGAAGAQGATGPAGVAGPQGPAGNAGASGTNGEPGAPGTSVTSKERATGTIGKCTEGGSEFTAGTTKTYACNGKAGSPWSAGGTLPVGSTETGAWEVGPLKREKAEGGVISIAIASFPIPLAAPLSGEGCNEQAATCHVHYINTEGLESIGVKFGESPEPEGEEVEPQTSPAPCPGSAAEPKATSGNLCIYAGETNGAYAQTNQIGILTGVQGGSTGKGASTAGATQLFFLTEGFEPSATGSWAVTG
jgi:hypothetical protein